MAVISGQVGNITGALFKIWLRWRRLIRAFVLVSLIGIGVIYAVWLVWSLWRGVALITGLPDPGPG